MWSTQECETRQPSSQSRGVPTSPHEKSARADQEHHGCIPMVPHHLLWPPSQAATRPVLCLHSAQHRGCLLPDPGSSVIWECLFAVFFPFWGRKTVWVTLGTGQGQGSQGQQCREQPNRVTSLGGRGHPITYFACVRGGAEISPCLLQWQAHHHAGDTGGLYPTT